MLTVKQIEAAPGDRHRSPVTGIDFTSFQQGQSKNLSTADDHYGKTELDGAAASGATFAKRPDEINDDSVLTY
jgi:hypothetical protein